MKILYWSGHAISSLLFDALFPGETAGAHWIPRSGPFILAANHASFFDPPAIGCRVPRPMYYFARRTLFKPGLPDKILRGVNTIPVDLEGDSDIAAMKAVFRVLKEGEGILLFPEGTRTYDGNLQPARSGVGMIACKSGVPVVPARIFGSYEAFGRRHRLPVVRRPIHVAFAPPLLPAQYDVGGKGKDRYREASEVIMRAIAAIPPPGEPPGV